MPSKRDAVLEGTLQAARLQRDLKLKETIAHRDGRVDVFAAVIDEGAQLVFRKLEGLLGAYIPVPSPGILVTTERTLAIQRFTAAHELGHFFMKHRGSLDYEEILHRSPFASPSYDPNEVAADAFASEFLLPEWLVEYHAQRQKWSIEDIANAANVYQLSLRVGLSYEATCWILQKHRLIQRDALYRLLETPRKKIKQQLLAGHSLANWFPNVWVLSEKDAGAAIHGEPNDVFVVRLKEHTGSGYLWNLEQLTAAGFVVVSDERQSQSEDEIGGAVERILTARSEDASIGNIDFVETRPWDHSDVFGKFSFAYDFRGKEHGMPRAARERFAVA
jgi:Zn-dependent peptidase ImmA (M78 family)/predicted secreted protein